MNTTMRTPEECTPDESWPVGKYTAFYSCFIVLALGAFDFIDRQILAALLPFIKSEWSLTDTQLGLLVSVVNVMLAVLVIPSAYLIDRWSRKKMIAIMAGIWSLATGACAFAGSFTHLLTARLFIGAGEAGYNPAAQALLSAQFPKKYRGTAIAITQLGMTLGTPLGLLLGAYIATHWGWRHAFGVVAIPGLILAILSLFIRDYKSVPMTVHSGNNLQKESYVTVLLHLLKIPSLLCAFIGAPLMMMYGGALMNWLPSYLIREGSMSVTEASSKAAIIMLSSVAATCFIGPGIDLFRKYRKNAAPISLFLCYLFSGILLLIAYNGPTPGSNFQIILLFIGNTLGGVTGAGFSIIIVDLVLPHVRATAISLMIVTQNIFGFALGPLFTGMLSDYFDLATAMNLMCGVIFLAAIICFICSFTFIRDMDRVGCQDVDFS